MDVEKILQQMTLEEKIALCSGENFWQTKTFAQYGIPALFMCDGPHGLRKQENGADMLGVHESREATCFPAEVTAAGSWDPELLEQIGAAIGEEAKDQGVGLVLGPGANLKRNPLCGRNFEYFSEDPLLAGKCCAAEVRGIQSNKIAVSIKHFACNNRESNRFECDSRVSERALREIYLRGFEICVREADPWTVMSSYNLINGNHTSTSYELLTEMLRGEWGFKGMVTTDWGVHSAHSDEIKAGNDLKMGDGDPAELRAAYESGKLTRADLEKSVRRVLELALKMAD